METNATNMQENCTKTEQQQKPMTEEEIEIQKAIEESLKDSDNDDKEENHTTKQEQQQNKDQNRNSPPSFNDFMNNIFSFVGNLFQQQPPCHNQSQQANSSSSQQETNQNQPGQFQFPGQQQQPQQQFFNQMPNYQFPYPMPYFVLQYPWNYSMVPPQCYPCFQPNFFPINGFPFLLALQSILPFLFQTATNVLNDISKDKSKDGKNLFTDLFEQLNEMFKQTEKESKDGQNPLENVIQNVFKILFPQKPESKEKKDGTDSVAKQTFTDERLEDGTMKHSEKRSIGNRSLTLITLALNNGTKKTTKEKENIKDDEIEEFNKEWESIMKLD